MASRRVDDRSGDGSRGRRLDAILILAFVIMLTAGLALFPLSVASNQLSGLWMTLCASLGID